MIKSELREKMREKRRALIRDDVDAMSKDIYNNLFSLDCVKSAGTVCTFLSAFKEPDTLTTITRLLKEGRRVCVPVTDEEKVTLSLSYIDSTDNLTRGAYGIYEPSAVREASFKDVDVILVPALAFDRNGGRMGFGKGYYDRLLCNSDVVKIGLCYDFQLFNEIPTESHDVPMNFIVTEKEIVKVSDKYAL